MHELEGSDALGEPGAGQVDGRQRVGLAAFLEGLARSVDGACRGGLAMGERGHRGGQHLLGFVDLLALQRLELGHFRKRQVGEGAQEAADIVVLDVAPVLPELVRAQPIRVEPYGAGGGLAHLGARRGGEQRRGEREQLRAFHAPAEVGAHHDIAPLVRPAHLQRAAVALRQFGEIIGLQDHIVEFDKTHLLVALEPELD